MANHYRKEFKTFGKPLGTFANTNTRTSRLEETKLLEPLSQKVKTTDKANSSSNKNVFANYLKICKVLFHFGINEKSLKL